MKFKTDRLSTELALVHPEVSRLMDDLDVWCASQGIHEPIITHAIRTIGEQEAIYTPLYIKTGFDEDSSRMRARGKFSWHLCRCAVDFRSSHYSNNDIRAVYGFIKQRILGRTTLFEFMQHDVGQGDHFHLGFRDYEWKKLYMPKMELVS